MSTSEVWHVPRGCPRVPHRFGWMWRRRRKQFGRWRRWQFGSRHAHGHIRHNGDGDERYDYAYHKFSAHRPVRPGRIRAKAPHAAGDLAPRRDVSPSDESSSAASLKYLRVVTHACLATSLPVARVMTPAQGIWYFYHRGPDGNWHEKSPQPGITFKHAKPAWRI